MKTVFRLILPIIDYRKLYLSFRGYCKFFVDYIRFNRISKNLRFKDVYPCLYDNTKYTSFDRHYIFHLSWAARILAITKPKEHIDISSSLYFCSIVSAFIPIKFFDYRPANLNLSNLVSDHANLFKLHFPDEYASSLSCMHTIEHIGLGRYGDPIDPEGDLKAINELKRILSKGGNLLFVVPIGKPRIMFNAHRIYSYDQIIDFFSDFQLMDFSLVPDDKKLGFIQNSNKTMADEQQYGCGCFWFKKLG